MPSSDQWKYHQTGISHQIPEIRKEYFVLFTRVFYKITQENCKNMCIIFHRNRVNCISVFMVLTFCLKVAINSSKHFRTYLFD